MRRVVAIVLVLMFSSFGLAATDLCPPGWDGTTLISGDDVNGWGSWPDVGSSGVIRSGTGYFQGAMELDWDLGTGGWVRAAYHFENPVDVSRYDIFGLTLRGDASSAGAQRLTIMFGDEDGTVFAHECDGLHLTERWLINQALPKQAFSYSWAWQGANAELDWSRVTWFYVGVEKHDPGEPGDSGVLSIDELRADRAARWERPQRFTAVAADTPVAVEARDYILSQERDTGLFRSWKGQWPPTADLYDQALTLMVLTREGVWDETGMAQDRFAWAADRLVEVVTSYQLPDYHWPGSWNPDTGLILRDDGWAGDQAWWIMALTRYAEASGSQAAEASAAGGTMWLRAQVSDTGYVVDSSEGSAEVWWALMLRGQYNKAARVAHFHGTQAWDADLGTWFRDVTMVDDHWQPDGVISMGSAIMGGALARTGHADSSHRARQALGLVSRTLVTETEDGGLCGFDGLGPVSLANDAMGQYVTMGGPDADLAIRELKAQQRRNGSFPGSPESWNTPCQTWHVTWPGLAPTAWTYFALTGSPLPSLYPIYWRHRTDGRNSLWLMNGERKVRGWSGLVDLPDTSWEIVGTGDFDGDQVLDLVLRHRQQGANAIWLMDGDSLRRGVSLLSVPDTAWRIAGVGDMDRDGDPDLVWQRGAIIAIWVMDGTELEEGVVLEARLRDDAWLVSGVGDFDGDDDGDLLLRHQVDGRNAVWFLERLRKVGADTLFEVPGQAWQVGGVGDLDGDGDADLLWRHLDGRNALWTLDGTALVDAVYLDPVPPVWDMVGPR